MSATRSAPSLHCMACGYLGDPVGYVGGVVFDAVDVEPLRMTNFFLDQADDGHFWYPASSDFYYLLLRGDEPAEPDIPVAIRSGIDGFGVLVDPQPERAARQFYRLKGVDRTAQPAG